MTSSSGISSVCMIPARGGSKRIPNKNIRTFAGQPMIAHSIKAALQSGLFERIIVSTDSEEIARVSMECGAEVPFMRPSELADDHATTSDVVLHAMQWLEDHGTRTEYFCCLYATAPFVRIKYLKEGNEILARGDGLAAYSVTTYAYPILRSLRITEQHRLEMIWPEYRRTRSQDLPECYHDAGQFYWYHFDTYLSGNGNVAGGAVPIIIPRQLVQDIDTIEDWEMAELKFKVLQKSGR